MSVVYDTSVKLPQAVQEQLAHLLRTVFQESSRTASWKTLQNGLRALRKETQLPLSHETVIAFYRQEATKYKLPAVSAKTLAQIRLKPMRSQSGIHSVSVLTKPFPCPGKCIFCPNDIRMPKSYIASEPGAQRAERNSFDPYLQTYNRLLALKNIGHEPSKIEIIVLGGTWSYYPEPYQIWFITECFRALNDFSQHLDNRSLREQAIAQSIQTSHRQENRVINTKDIAIDGNNLAQSYNQVVSQYYLAPEQKQDQAALPKREHATWEELEKEQQTNESAACRCVGLTLETRPDNISPAEVMRIRRLGATKTQIGFQSLSDTVLELNKRGHLTDATKKAVQLLRQAGFKIHAHWMPNLYGSSLENDMQEYHQLFEDPAYKPNELKIYPCALIPSAELVQYFHMGKWQPYRSEQLKKLLKYVLIHTPAWVRLTRVIRDIPSQEVMTDNIKTNFRQLVQDELTAEGIPVVDIRAREIRHQIPQEPLCLECLSYQTSSSTEEFWQYVDADGKLLGFVRLSLPNQEVSLPDEYAELKNHALVRELHVYGNVEKVGERAETSTQHQGLGSKLLQQAEEQAQKHGFSAISVISAIGTRGYYAKRGYTLGKLYQSKSLAK